MVMDKMPRKPKVESDQQRIDREAADWVVQWEDREREPAPKQQSRWFGWLQRSPRHVQSYFDVLDIHERLGRIDPHNKIDVDQWLAEGRAPVVPLGSTTPDRMRATGISASSPAWRQRSLAASIIALIAAALLWGWAYFAADDYRTAIGQQSLNTLADGSIMNLNTRSRASVHFSARERVIDLDGEALFTVARDPRRPFVVRTRDATIRALGTRFNVYEQDAETRVAVIEGKVEVMSEHGGGLALSSGEAARVVRGQVIKEIVPDVQTRVAWQQQKLVFEDATLGTVASEFNRYNTVQFRVEGSIGNTKRLSGTFDALYPRSLLLYLQQDAAMRVSVSGETYRVRGIDSDE